MAMPMSGYDRAKMVRRSRSLVALGATYGVTVISPVLEESVREIPGALTPDDQYQLHRFWKRDKEIIRNRDGKGAHVVLIDRADHKSLGCEREYGFNRHFLWKPTLCLMRRHGYSVAKFEDDRIFADADAAFAYIARNYGTHMQRIRWRLRMLIRSLPGFVIDQIAAWR
jgi:hypothetical protein